MKIFIRNKFIYRIVKNKEYLDYKICAQVASANGNMEIFKFGEKYEGQELELDDETFKIIPNSVRFITE